MSSIEIQQLREDLGLTQSQFGQLLGIHPMTVSKWERANDPSEPNDYQVAMMEKFKEGTAKEVGIGAVVAAALVGLGVVTAVYLLLKAAMKK
jgi:transcriptional regulator with XRE-family HTH domain